jgi:hypothetical protein
MQRPFIAFFCIAFSFCLYACFPKEKDKNNSQAIDTTAGLPETLPQAQIDEKFLNLVKEIKPTKFVVYANDVEQFFRTKIAPQIEEEKEFAGFLSRQVIDELGLPQMEFAKGNKVWIQNKWINKNFIVLLAGVSPDGMLREELHYYLLTFSLEGKLINYIPWALFREISPSIETKSFSTWEEYKVKSHFEQIFYGQFQQKRYVKTITEYQIDERGWFEKVSDKKRESFEDNAEIEIADKKRMSEIYDIFPFQEEGFSLSERDIKVKEDEDNAFLEIEKSDEMSPPKTVYFTYFVDNSQNKTFGHQYYAMGTVGDSDYNTEFYRIEGKMWKNVTDEICPTLSFKDFWDSSEELPPLKIFNRFAIKYQLPQNGTTVVATLEEQSLVDADIDLKAFERYKRKITYRKIDLKWNMDKGVFEIGKKY